MGHGHPLVSEDATVRRRVAVRDPQGLHARPCAAIAKAMRRFRCRAVLALGGKEADARSVLDLLGLALLTATEVEIRATGEDAAACADALATILATPPA